GDYRLRTRQLGPWALISVAEGHAAQGTKISFGEQDLAIGETHLAPGQVSLTLTNATDTSLLAILEQTAWSAQAVSAAMVTALDEFRQLFSSQVLAPGLGVSIRNLTFLFSDLKGSTMLYDTIGDSPAYARVRDHF